MEMDLINLERIHHFSSAIKVTPPQKSQSSQYSQFSQFFLDPLISYEILENRILLYIIYNFLLRKFNSSTFTDITDTL